MSTKLYQCIEKIKEEVVKNKEFLTELDSAIGDADHGINMNRGFVEVMKQLQTEEEDIGIALKKIGMTLLSKVGGASGPLYGTAFMKAGSVVVGKKNLSVNDAKEMLAAAVDGIKLRGKATRGEKTMIDAMEPALTAFIKGIEENQTMEACLVMACDAAKEGVEYTKTIRATKGRASYLGDRSIGHQDPGATSSLIIMETIKEFYQNNVK